MIKNRRQLMYVMLAFCSVADATLPIDGVYLNKGQATIRGPNGVQRLSKAKDCMVIKKKSTGYMIYVQSIQHLGDACYLDGSFFWNGDSGVVMDGDEKTGLKILLRNNKFSFLAGDDLSILCGQKADWNNVYFPMSSKINMRINPESLSKSCPAWNR